MTLRSTLIPAMVMAPVPAWAHGDHDGVRGAVHVMTSADHLGLALIALLLTGLGVRWVRGSLAGRGRDRADQS